MNRGLINSLTEAERMLIAETEPASLAELDEDGLATLHDRIRKARGKYRSIYRREAAGRVSAQGGRGKARPKNRRNSDRLEVFEDALSRVSRALASAARASAAELRTERIEAARAAKATPPVAAAPTRAPAKKRTSAAGATTKDSARKLPQTRKATAATRATGARRQAKRDSR